jgi:hypothetical protein
MKVTAPNDLQGRIIRCTNRARLITDALERYAGADGDGWTPSEETLKGLSQVADELCDELAARRD